jgi:hypothetical protein
MFSWEEKVTLPAKRPERVVWIRRKYINMNLAIFRS